MTRQKYRVPRGSALTARELQILQFAATGLSNGRIGDRLGLSEDTIKTHMRHAYQRLGARDRAHAVFLGCRAGLLNPADARASGEAS